MHQVRIAVLMLWYYFEEISMFRISTFWKRVLDFFSASTGVDILRFSKHGPGFWDRSGMSHDFKLKIACCTPGGTCTKYKHFQNVGLEFSIFEL